MSWLWPLGAGLVISAAALVASAAVLVFRDRVERLAIWLLAYATGTLLGVAALGLLPEAIAHGSIDRAMALFLAGVVGFIAFEHLLHARHGRTAAPAHAPLTTAAAMLILWGDALHNFLDGVVLGAMFGASPELGVTALVAIFAHEIPQEIGDLAILLAAGLRPRRALLLNYLSALAVLPGVALAFVWARGSEPVLGALLPIAAGAFVYLALADLVPTLLQRRSLRAGVANVVLIVAGVMTVALLSPLAH